MKCHTLQLVPAIKSTRTTDPLTRYKRWKLRVQLAASPSWIVSYTNEAMPCALCVPGKRRTTLTLIYGTYTSYEHRRTGIPICYVCLGKLSLKREREQPYLERRLYGIKTTPI